MSTADIVEKIDRRLARIDAEQTQLHLARAELIDGSTTAPRSVKPRGSRARAGKPNHEVVPAGRLTGLLADSQGLRTRELAQASNGSAAQILALLKEQESAGNVRRSGQRASTRWHLVTDEDRIATRAAELRARGARGRARRN